MATIAVLGTGLLGSGFAANLLNKGHQVRVWNRTASKCAPLVQAGAVHASSPADAARGAERVHLILAADAAVDAVIAALRTGLTPGAYLVDHSTNLPAATAARFKSLRDQGVNYIHAPVFMGPQNSHNASGLMLISGPPADIAALSPHLQQMTGTLMDLGERPDTAAATKLNGNGLLLMLAATMGDLFAVGRGSGLSPADVLRLFETFSPTAIGMGRRVLASGDGPASFELSMARKDIGLMIQTGGAENLTVLPGIAAAMDRALAKGDGSTDFTSFLKPPE